MQFKITCFQAGTLTVNALQRKSCKFVLVKDGLEHTGKNENDALIKMQNLKKFPLFFKVHARQFILWLINIWQNIVAIEFN